MMRRNLALGSMALVLALALLLSLLGAAMPAQMLLPVHWGLDGRPSIFATKWVALYLAPALIAANGLAFYALSKLEPLQEGLAKSQHLFAACWIAAIAIHLARTIADLSYGFGWDISSDRLIVAVAGAALVLIGNQLSKSRRMRLLGVVTPWTLANEDNWIATHRLAAKIVMTIGLMLVCSAMIGFSPETIRTVALGSLLSAAIPVAYSYRLRQRDIASDQGPWGKRAAAQDEERIDWRAYWISVALAAVLCAIVVSFIWQSQCGDGACAGENAIAKLFEIIVQAFLKGLPYVFAA